jgi:hypothetical protein
MFVLHKGMFPSFRNNKKKYICLIQNKCRTNLHLQQQKLDTKNAILEPQALTKSHQSTLFHNTHGGGGHTKPDEQTQENLLSNLECTLVYI